LVVASRTASSRFVLCTPSISVQHRQRKRAA
jgi:hypothetical protein